MDDIDEMLGIDPSNDVDRLAAELVRADLSWVEQLVTLRKQSGQSQEQVAKAMGRSQSVVSDIETMSSDPRLSSLRRYALAIGAAVKHIAFRDAGQHPLETTTGSTVVGVQTSIGSGSAYVSSFNPLIQLSGQRR